MQSLQVKPGLSMSPTQHSAVDSEGAMPTSSASLIQHSPVSNEISTMSPIQHSPSALENGNERVITTSTMSQAQAQHTSVDNEGYSNALPISLVTIKQEPAFLEIEINSVEYDNNVEESNIETPFIEIKIEQSSIKTEPFAESDNDVKSNSLDDAQASCFKCNVCNKQLKKKSDLEKHSLKFHNGGKPYFCIECGKIFSNKKALTRHLRTHSPYKPFACNICDKRFIDQGRLSRHMQIHTGNKAYSCSRCNKTFTQKNNVTRHMLTHIGLKPFSCSVCNKTFNENCQLKRHMKIHSGVKPYSCNRCTRMFNERTNLIRHIMSVHAGEKPYTCNECGLAVSDRGTLIDHLRIHTGEKPFSCPSCNRTFRQKSTLRGHMKTHIHENQADVQQTSPDALHVPQSAPPSLDAVDADYPYSSAHAPTDQTADPLT